MLRVTRSLVIPEAELRWRFDPHGGPGGRHANRAATRAEVSFDVTRSRVLGPRQRARLLARLGPVVTASASEERSQARNRDLARDRLRGKLAAALRVPHARRPTEPSAAAREHRLREKRRRAEVKRLRKTPREPGEWPQDL